MISGWASSCPHDDQDTVHNYVKGSRSSPDNISVESHRRSSSEATPRQTPATTRFLSSPTTNDDDTSRKVLTPAQDAFSTSRRLGYFADKLSSSLSGAAHSNINQLLHPHSQTSTASSPLPTMATSSSISNTSKSHTSPSKVTELLPGQIKFSSSALF